MGRQEYEHLGNKRRSRVAFVSTEYPRRSSLSYRKLLRHVPTCLILCTGLAAATSLPGSGQVTPNASLIWRLDAPDENPSPFPAVCSVIALPLIVDDEALAFERRASPDTGNLTSAMARALARFRQLVNLAGGTFELISAYRPSSYQAHLQAVWFKWMLELRNNRELSCQTLRTQVGEEFTRHGLLEMQKPVTSSDHTRGLAFDATVVLPLVVRLSKSRVSLDRLALLAGIQVARDVRQQLFSQRGLGLAAIITRGNTFASNTPKLQVDAAVADEC
jgi:hypothetical protein